MRKYGLVYYHSTENIGDDIQSYAFARFMPSVDYLVDRENLDAFQTSGERIYTPIFGWLMHSPLNFPPSVYLATDIISFHMAKPFNSYGYLYLKQHEPIGCRDTATLERLGALGIDAYFSGCVTLTLERFSNATPHGKIVLVDVPETVEAYVKTQGADYLTRTHAVPNENKPSWAERTAAVEELLRLYQGARLVITTRLHAALPTLALGVPVLLVRDDFDSRFTPYLEHVRHLTVAEFLAGGYDLYNIVGNSNTHLKLRQELIARIKKLFKDRSPLPLVEEKEILKDYEGRIYALKRDCLTLQQRQEATLKEVNRELKERGYNIYFTVDQ